MTMLARDSIMVTCGDISPLEIDISPYFQTSSYFHTFVFEHITRYSASLKALYTHYCAADEDLKSNKGGMLSLVEW